MNKSKRLKSVKSVKIAKVALLGNPVLTNKTFDMRAEEIISSETQKLIKTMLATCKKMSGAGIAAPQIFSDKSIFILAPEPNERYPHAKKIKPVAVINPRIIKKSPEKEKDWEGCLSIPGLRGLVPRHTWVTVEYHTPIKNKAKKVRKTFTDFTARVFQHEFDHLQGVLFIDRTRTSDLYSEKEFRKVFELKRLELRAEKTKRNKQKKLSKKKIGKK